MRVSFSILDAWAKGDYDRAVAPFVGEEIEPTEAMADGKRFHAEWEAETKKSGNLPAVFGGGNLILPQLERETKRVVQINDWLTLSGILDLLHGAVGEIGVDYKRSTATTSSQYANSFQHKVYQILYPRLTQFHYYVFNPATRETTFSICHLSDKTLEEGIEWVLTHASDLRAYLEANNISLERRTHEQQIRQQ